MNQYTEVCDERRRPIIAGTILREGDEAFRVLEDTTAHGCPLVEVIDPGQTNYHPGDRRHRTLNQHLTSTTEPKNSRASQ